MTNQETKPAMVGAQEPVAWQILNGVCHAGIRSSEALAKEAAAGMQKTHDLGGSLAAFHVRPLYAAPVAQQYEAGDTASAAAQGFRDGVASVTQQEPPRCDDCGDTVPKRKCYCRAGCVHEATPPAQQPHQCALCGSDEAFTGACGGGKNNPRALCYEPVAQQPQEIEVQCPVCNHKFYEWPNDKQPQAEAVPVVDRVYEAAKRLVDHADFQLGGVLSAKSKARDIPSNAASKVKARHLASLRDALAKTPQQAEAVPLPPQLMVDMVPPATARDRWMYEQGRLAERDPRTHAAPVAQQQAKPRKADVARTCPFCNEEWVEQPQAAPQFPTMLRKMWSGSEVQQWINENWPAAPQQAEAVPSDWRSLLRQSEDNFVRQFGVSVSAAWAYRDIEDLFAAAPQQAEAVSADQSKWCAYVAGVIGCYLGEADDSAKVKAIAGIIERRMWASAHQPLKIAAWRGVHVEGDYLYYDEFPEELTNEQRRQLHLKPLYEGAAPQQAEAVPSDVARIEALEASNVEDKWIVGRNKDSFTVALSYSGSVTRQTLREAIDAAIAQQKGGGA